MQTLNAAAPLLRRVTARDAHEHALNLSHWDQVYDQIGRGDFAGTLDEIWFGDLHLFRERTSVGVLESGSAWPGSRTFGVPVAMDGWGAWCGRLVGLDSLVTLGPRDTLDFRTPPGLDIIGISLEARAFAAFSRTVEDRDWELALQARPLVAVPPPQMARLRDLLLDVFATADQAPERLRQSTVRATLRDQVLEHVVGALGSAEPEPAPSFTRQVRRGIVNRAREFAAGNAGQALTVAALCAALKVSRRTLQTCFQEVLALSPHHYLQARRLNGLRRTLLAPDSGADSVQDAAARWGFWHLSACAAEYRRMFGELPSATLRRRPSATGGH